MAFTKSDFKAGVIDFICGSAGGVALVAVTQPFDTIKVKLQTYPQLYKGTVHCLIKTYKKDGFTKGLYAGSLAAVAAHVSENAVLFSAYGRCQKLVGNIQNKSAEELDTFGNACAGSLASCFSSVALCPTELIKCKMQVLRETIKDERLRPTTKQLIREIYQTDGIKGFFRGISVTIFREMPGFFFFFGGYEGARELFRKPNEKKEDIGPLKTMLSGAIGGILLWIIILPADCIKSRIQINNLDIGMLAVLKDILKNEGFSALYRGLCISLVRTVPANGVLFCVYEYTKKFLNSILL